MGLFSFVGKAVKGIAHLAGGVAKLGVGALRSGLIPLPLGGTAGRILGGLLHAKSPMGHSALKLRIGQPLILRGKSATPRVTVHTPNGIRTVPTITALRRSPVMPGGAIATRNGVASRPMAGPGGAKIGSGGPKRKRRRRASGTYRTSSRRSRSSSQRSGHRKRRLKFGSPAWRKKYLGHGRKRRKRRAA